MATATKGTATKKRTVKRVTKSDKMRAMFKEGKSIVEVQQALRVGYAFAYGVAKRSGYAATAAKRRSTKSVSIVGDEVIVQIVSPEGVYGGTVTVNLFTGKTSRKAPRAAKA